MDLSTKLMPISWLSFFTENREGMCSSSSVCAANVFIWMQTMLHWSRAWSLHKTLELLIWSTDMISLILRQLARAHSFSMLSCYLSTLMSSEWTITVRIFELSMRSSLN